MTNLRELEDNARQALERCREARAAYAKAQDNLYHAMSLASRGGGCGLCGADVVIGTEAAEYEMCRDCFNETNSQFGVGA